MKWTPAAELKLLKTALALGPNYMINAKAVAAAFPLEIGEEKPTERAVKDRFNAIKKSARDLINLQKVKDEEAGKLESAVKRETVKNEVTTPANSFVKRLMGKKSSTGSKRKCRGQAESSDEAMATDEETSSDFESVVTPTPATRRSLRARKSLPAALAMPEDSDNEVDAGAKTYDSGCGDDEYDFAEERRKKFAKKAKASK